MKVQGSTGLWWAVGGSAVRGGAVASVLSSVRKSKGPKLWVADSHCGCLHPIAPQHCGWRHTQWVLAWAGGDARPVTDPVPSDRQSPQSRAGQEPMCQVPSWLPPRILHANTRHPLKGLTLPLSVSFLWRMSPGRAGGCYNQNHGLVCLGGTWRPSKMGARPMRRGLACGSDSPAQWGPGQDGALGATTRLNNSNIES